MHRCQLQGTQAGRQRSSQLGCLCGTQSARQSRTPTKARSCSSICLGLPPFDNPLNPPASG
jgi:hypothetical protein